MDHCWEFWIDVGGKFTDCFAHRPDGSLLRHKVLSSGVTKGRIQAVTDGGKGIVAPSRRGEPDGFWRGYLLRPLDASGTVLDSSSVASNPFPDGLAVARRNPPAVPESGDHTGVGGANTHASSAIVRFSAGGTDGTVRTVRLRQNPRNVP